MDRQQIPLKVTAARFAGTVGDFVSSDVGGKAKLMFAGLIALLCGISGLNVVNSYVGRNFITAIADRQTPEFIRQSIFYVSVFAVLTVVSVIARFVEERLALLWRQFITRRAVALYLANGTYYRLGVSGQLTNPDQRIADDVRAFTVTTLSFVVMVFNGTLTIVAFSGLLWSISPLLFVVAVLYAACGSCLTFLMGRPLINLNYDQLDKEADFRSSLIHLRENAESILLARAEERQNILLSHRLEALAANFRRITAVNRNVGFFTTGYNWLIQIIPALIIAPAFISGEIEFGVITQSGAAFAMLVGAFSLIVTQYQSISTFAAVVARLNSLPEAIERSQTIAEPAIEFVEREGSLAYERLTLLSSNGAPLLKELSVTIPVGTLVLLTGPSHAAGTALFRATAGIPTLGTGRIIRPVPDDIQFLQQRPYLPPGTLRQILERSENPDENSDERIFHVLRELDLERLVSLAGGLDRERGWEMELSLTEQQLLMVANVLLATPRFVFMDRVDTTLGSEQLRKILRLLSERSITCINNGGAHDSRGLYHAVLEYGEDGGWKWTSNRA
ncbi:putative ATP-binding cassette transporter [Rhizobium binae]|uniref:ATP-binding cassette transporter n=1 Tax=Rhizobium binae TaxID=1138190 RepID=A0ABV2MLZ3_9HYPH|nr:ABC transporter ATP-binding protein/permease [Rhizobium binae]MBX4969519.1 ABC transporter ATP-binding protein/permease [Rhizobium binae]MBX4993702.1 ABC transporter ATP-binding protein/permease [Rhizobium binae]NKL46766.1 ABC transporter ATP-binding protein/permease [Rhizobium leguminosarum bv. viciae]QSY83404.1 ABC transporter ATP-binding protein/permease [Rhizobium binae]